MVKNIRALSWPRGLANGCKSCPYNSRGWPGRGRSWRWPLEAKPSPCAGHSATLLATGHSALRKCAGTAKSIAEGRLGSSFIWALWGTRLLQQRREWGADVLEFSVGLQTTKQADVFTDWCLLEELTAHLLHAEAGAEGGLRHVVIRCSRVHWFDLPWPGLCVAGYRVGNAPHCGFPRASLSCSSHTYWLLRFWATRV